MREILFRGKKVDVGDWVEGFYYKAKYYVADKELCDFITTPHPEEKGRRSDHFMVIPESISEFTGVIDKNGKKIFEGDIGIYQQTDGAKRNGKPIACMGKVVYNEKTASFAVESKDEAGCKYFDYFPIKDFEVIGNIHDNELEVRNDR